MKKTKILSVSAILASLAIMAGGSLLANADDGNLPTSTIDAWKFAGGWDVDSSYVSNGVKAVVKGADTVGDDAWQQRLVVNNDDSVGSNYDSCLC